jgi:hypothetical protein
MNTGWSAPAGRTVPRRRRIRAVRAVEAVRPRATVSSACRRCASAFIIATPLATEPVAWARPTSRRRWRNQQHRLEQVGYPQRAGNGSYWLHAGGRGWGPRSRSAEYRHQGAVSTLSVLRAVPAMRSLAASTARRPRRRGVGGGLHIGQWLGPRGGIVHDHPGAGQLRPPIVPRPRAAARRWRGQRQPGHQPAGQQPGRRPGCQRDAEPAAAPRPAPGPAIAGANRIHPLLSLRTGLDLANYLQAAVESPHRFTGALRTCGTTARRSLRLIAAARVRSPPRDLRGGWPPQF